MLRWARILCVCCSLAVAGLVHATALAGEFSTDLDSDRYDCSLTVTAAKTAARGSTAHLTLEADPSQGAVELTIGTEKLTLFSVHAGKKTLVAVMHGGCLPGTSYALTVMRRGTTLLLQHDYAIIARAMLPHGPGCQAGLTLDAGWMVRMAPRIQRLELAVYFTDDFMRQNNAITPWVARSGAWGLQSAWDDIPQGDSYKNYCTSSAQNAFSLGGYHPKGGEALCTTGEPFWEDYTISFSVRPQHGDVVGVVVNMPNAKNGGDDGVYVLWSSIGAENRLSLRQKIHGHSVELGSSPGGFIPGQWAKIGVTTSLDGVRVSIDGNERLAVKNVTPFRGGIGLYVHGNRPTTFDDVTVYGSSINTDLLLETKLTKIGQSFIDDGGMRDWSDSKNDWEPATGLPNQYWWRRDIYGDHQWMTLTAVLTPYSAGELWMVLNGDGSTETAGYRAVIRLLDGKTRQFSYSIYRNDRELVSKTATALTAGREYTFRFWRSGARLRLEVEGGDATDDENVVLEAVDKGAPLAGRRPAYRASGCFATARNVLIFSHNILDYTFAEAPTDWWNVGTWESTIRWSCQPMWSFLSGWSRGDAVMWHKDRFVGDQSFQAYVGVKMEYSREREIYFDRYHDLAITLCGDGHNPRSGYTGIYAASGEARLRMLLLRDGKVVASQPLPDSLVPGFGPDHRSWFDLVLQKTGATIAFHATVNGQTLDLSYTDPAPIVGGSPAIWTTNSGISIARARMDFANPPQLRPQPEVVIDHPWYPEWANVKSPLTLCFPASWATNGQPVHLEVTPQDAPADDKDAVHVSAPLTGAHADKTASTQAVFTPTREGYHWYQITASDGANQSFPFHLELPVFDPRQHQRDDSHALVLYRFTEGQGHTIHDQSMRAPAADMTIFSDPALTAQWVPRQGVLMRANSRVMTETTTGADKLMAIANTHACTVECWISPDTIYPPNKLNWTSGLFSWDLFGASKGDQRNLIIGQYNDNVLVFPRGQEFSSNATMMFPNGFRVGLIHLVVTWDGTTTRVYVNGGRRDTQSQMIPWPVSQLGKGSMIILGNTADGGNPYLGTYYLLAVHDRCLSDADVMNNYLAGPTAP